MLSIQTTACAFFPPMREQTPRDVIEAFRAFRQRQSSMRNDMLSACHAQLVSEGERLELVSRRVKPSRLAVTNKAKSQHTKASVIYAQRVALLELTVQYKLLRVIENKLEHVYTDTEQLLLKRIQIEDAVYVSETLRAERLNELDEEVRMRMERFSEFLKARQEQLKGIRMIGVRLPEPHEVQKLTMEYDELSK